jgi:hypothetical protein
MPSLADGHLRQMGASPARCTTLGGDGPGACRRLGPNERAVPLGTHDMTVLNNGRTPNKGRPNSRTDTKPIRGCPAARVRARLVGTEAFLRRVTDDDVSILAYVD